MAAPYAVRWGWAFERSSATIPTLAEAIHRCREIRAQVQARPGSVFEPKIFGDNIDVDNAYGLSTDERGDIWEAGLE